MANEDDDSLADAFWAVARRLRGRSRDALAPRGLTPALSRALRVLLHDGPMRPGQLSQRLRIAPRSTTEVVDALAERGLVERHRDPADRRATLVNLTDAGLQLGRDLGDARRTEAERLFAELSPRDRADLARVLRKLRD